jgi:hypothetical protein
MNSTPVLFVDWCPIAPLTPRNNCQDVVRQSSAAANKELQEKLNACRAEMIAHYERCPKHPKPPAIGKGVGYEIRIVDEEDEEQRIV